MFLRNYDNYMAGLNLLESVAVSGANTNLLSNLFTDGYFNQRAADGSSASIYYNPGASFFPPASLSAKGICLGTGSTEVSYDDFRLSGNVIENKLIEVSKDVTYIASTGKIRKTLVATYTNSSDKNITISEWGLWRVNVSSGGSSVIFDHAKNEAALVYRAVLDDPIVIEAGTTATLTFSIDIPMPNHP